MYRAKEVSVSLLKKMQYKLQKFLKAGQLVSSELCVASATQIFRTNPVCSMVYGYGGFFLLPVTLFKNTVSF